MLRTVVLVFCLTLPYTAARCGAAESTIEVGDNVMPREGCRITNSTGDISLKGRVFPFVVQSITGSQADVGYGLTAISSLVRLDEADAYYSSWIQRDPQNVDAYFLRSQSRANKEDYEGANDDLSAAIRLRPDSYRLYLCRADVRKVLCRKKKGAIGVEDMLDDCNRGIRLNPDDSWGYIARVDCYAVAGKENANAAKIQSDTFRAMISLPENEHSFYRRGLLYQAMNLHDRAIADFTEAIRLHPHYAEAYSLRGLSWRIKRNFDRAMADYHRAVELAPKEARAYVHRSNGYDAMGDAGAAIKDAEKSIELSPNDPVNLVAYVEKLIHRNSAKVRDPAKALSLAKRAYELDPDDYATRWAMGAALAENGDYSSAEQFLLKALEFESRMSKDDKARIKYGLSRARQKAPVFHEVDE